MKNALEEHLQLTSWVAQAQIALLETVSREIFDCFSRGNKVLICGNGGSAADAQHFAAELSGRFVAERRGLPAVALTTDSSVLTAVGNDYGFERIFARQVEALCSPGDMVIGLSTSGNSANVDCAFTRAKELEGRTLGFLGRDGGTLASKSDLAFIVPSEVTARIQEIHILMIHLICERLDALVLGADSQGSE